MEKMKIIGVSFEQGNYGKNKGTKDAFEAVQKKLDDFYISENAKNPSYEFKKIDSLPLDIKEALKKIEEKLTDETKAILIGGDHSITYASFKAFAKKYSNPGLIVFDAHPDMMDDGMNTHEDYFSKLIADGILKKENACVCAVRNWHRTEYDFINQNKIKIFTMKHVQEIGIESACDSIMEFSKDFDGLYISIDIDAVDPAFAPGTGYIEPAGLSSRELIYFMQRLKLMKNLKFMDIVEINPTKDLNEMTSSLAAKIIIEVLG